MNLTSNNKCKHKHTILIKANMWFHVCSECGGGAFIDI